MPRDVGDAVPYGTSLARMRATNGRPYIGILNITKTTDAGAARSLTNFAKTVDKSKARGYYWLTTQQTGSWIVSAEKMALEPEDP